MKAKVEEMKALVIEAEAEVPKALAKALNSGKMGVMDYYNMKNLQADTDMRKSLSKKSGDGDDSSSQESPVMPSMPFPRNRIKPTGNNN